MKRLILIILIGLTLLLAGCGEDEASPTPEAAPAEAAAQAGTPTAVGESPAATPADAGASALSPEEVAAGPTVAAPDATQPVTVGAPTGTVSATVAAPAGAPVTATVATTATGAVTPTLTAAACAVEPNADLVGYDGLVDKMGCPLEEAGFDPVAINEFGAGPEYDRFMLWFNSERQIYVLFPDGAWLAYTDTWDESQPELLCNPENLDPATSPPLPRRGFGKLWCSVESVRTALGTIDREERLCQHSVTQRFENGRLIACFEDATIRYFRILDSGNWDMMMVQ